MNIKVELSTCMDYRFLVRRSGSWQSVWDDRILEAAASDDDGIVNVGDLADNEYIRVGQSQVSRRCKKLAEHSLLRKIGNGVYIITDEGRAYLREEYDAEAGIYLDNSDSCDGSSASESGSNGEA